MMYIGMDVHQESTTFCVLDPLKEASSAEFVGKFWLW